MYSLFCVGNYSKNKVEKRENYNYTHKKLLKLLKTNKLLKLLLKTKRKSHHSSNQAKSLFNMNNQDNWFNSLLCHVRMVWKENIPKALVISGMRFLDKICFSNIIK